MPKIRQVQNSDLDVLYRISLETGFAGTDASHLYKDRMLLGHIYSASYARLKPGLALVIEDDAGVAGFAVGALDTERWEARLEREWWPDLRLRYSDPRGVPSDWTMDQKRCAMIHHPELTPTRIAREYPAHLHLNLLTRLQHQGVGALLLHAWLELARSQGAKAVHVGVNRANLRAQRFWTQRGFQPLMADDGPERTTWMGSQQA